ncbi:hypothetical protein JCM8547_000502 [Rhodosporidiobolus lusitaniae]
MPPVPQQSKPVVDSSFRYVITWDVSFDITSTSVNLEEKPCGLTLASSWTAHVQYKDGKMTVGLNYSAKGLSKAYFGEVVATHIELLWVDGFTAKSPSLGTRLAQPLLGINLEQLPHDVRLFFPHVHEKGAELWVKADFLSKSSTYFRDLFASGLAETIPRRSKRARTDVEQVVLPSEKDFDDSDDETDAFLF